MAEIERGSSVIITDASGDEHQVEALSSPKAGHKFAIVWVNVPKYEGGFQPMPWPLDSVRLESP